MVVNMSIYILDLDLQKSVESLDDRSLRKQCRDLAQTLCDIHYCISDNNPPLKPDFIASRPGGHYRWVEWGAKCNDRYEWLLNYFKLSLEEHTFRFHDWIYGKHGDENWIKRNRRVTKPYYNVYPWAHSNRPNILTQIEFRLPRIVPVHIRFNDLCLNYQLYHSWRLSEKLKCKYCNGRGNSGSSSFATIPSVKCCICDGNGFTFKYKPTWTKREKPEWI